MTFLASVSDGLQSLQPLMTWWSPVDKLIEEFIYNYPLFMAYIWMFGAVIFYLRCEWRQLRELPNLNPEVPVSILIPCYNEGDNVRETIAVLERQHYKNIEIIAVNDGSTDNTLDILHELAERYSNVRVVNLATNQGKAMGLRTATLLANSEILICIDGDALLSPDAIGWMVKHFIENPHVGAVTGNPRIRNRSTLLGRIQVGEFSAIVGMIKRAQRSYGKVFTVSGVIAAFRKSALHDVGYWSNDMITEDIDISWKLQLAGWTVHFEPNALCWVLMPETINGLWKQRVRWSQGGSEVLLRYFPAMFKWSARGMWPLYVECLISVCWGFLIFFHLLFIPLELVTDSTYELLHDLSPSWTSMLLSITCLLQFGVSLSIDSRYEHETGIGRYYYWMVWYPIVYWLMNIGTIIVGTIRAVKKKRGQRAVWVTVDRGLRHK